MHRRDSTAVEIQDSEQKMSTHWRAVVLLTVVSAVLFRSTAADEVAEILTEKELEHVVAGTEFVLVLYSKYFRRCRL